MARITILYAVTDFAGMCELGSASKILEEALAYDPKE